MNLVKNIIPVLLILAGSSLKAQDSLKTLSAAQVMELVKQFHPVAKQATIFVEKAKADVTIAKGMFCIYDASADGVVFAEFFTFARNPVEVRDRRCAGAEVGGRTGGFEAAADEHIVGG